MARYCTIKTNMKLDPIFSPCKLNGNKAFSKVNCTRISFLYYMNVKTSNRQICTIISIQELDLPLTHAGRWVEWSCTWYEKKIYLENCPENCTGCNILYILQPV